MDCNCKKCVSMCENRPCWGTPKEIKRIIELGHNDKLMVDWWAGDEEDIYILSPAIVGYEKKKAPDWPTGRCTFLTEDNLCSIHEAKPTEGKLADHTHGDDGTHKKMAMSWDTEEGKKLVKEFLNEI